MTLKDLTWLIEAGSPVINKSCITACLSNLHVIMSYLLFLNLESESNTIFILHSVRIVTGIRREGRWSFRDQERTDLHSWYTG